MNDELALTMRAPAKINLTLHVLGRRAGDGYHELQSLVAFAGVCDHLTFAPGAELALSVDGPTADAAGAGPDNLVLRAARNLQERVEGLRVGAFRLTKYLPVAAGIGGGSSDAAAALRLLAQENGIALDDRARHGGGARDGRRRAGLRRSGRAHDGGRRRAARPEAQSRAHPRRAGQSARRRSRRARYLPSSV